MKDESVIVTGGGKYIATDAVIQEDKSELHYSVVVLREDQLDRIAEAVLKALAKRVDYIRTLYEDE